MNFQKPSDIIFNEIKTEAIKIWQTYDDTFGYASSKINIIKDIKNIENNVITFVNMFDPINQRKLLNCLSEDSRKYVIKNILDNFYNI